MSSWLNHVDCAETRLADQAADRAQYLIRHGTMRAGLYAPRIDDQAAHVQDELYIFRTGRARFFREDEVEDVEEGHVIFVPAGTNHRFEAISDDFATYVVFWGANDGETDR